MTNVEVTLQLSDDVARQARRAGLLRPERIAELIEREITQSREAEAKPQANESDRSLRPENERLLALVEAWMAEPDDLGDDWWAEFEESLMVNRFTIRRPARA